MDRETAPDVTPKKKDWPAWSISTGRQAGPVQKQHYRDEHRGRRFIADMLYMGGVGAPRAGP